MDKNLKEYHYYYLMSIVIGVAGMVSNDKFTLYFLSLWALSLLIAVTEQISYGRRVHVYMVSTTNNVSGGVSLGDHRVEMKRQLLNKSDYSELRASLEAHAGLPKDAIVFTSISYLGTIPFRQSMDYQKIKEAKWARKQLKKNAKKS